MDVDVPGLRSASLLGDLARFVVALVSVARGKVSAATFAAAGIARPAHDATGHGNARR
jgi:hypothetical protein